MLHVHALSNHGRDLAFAKKFTAAVQDRFDRVVGFNKLFDLDYLYCADPSVRDKKRKWWGRVLPRHFVQTRLEEACFAATSRTRLLMLSQASADSYRQHWDTPAERIAVLPPVMNPSRRRPQMRTAEHRESVRTALGLPLDQTIWLWVGTKPHTKGLDRVIAALPHFPGSILIAVGVEAASPEGRRAWPHSVRAGVSDRVRFLGYRDDVPDVMAAADLLVHPTRMDVTGQVVLEALVNGLPVVTSELCGFAEYVRDADAGVLIREPFVASEFEEALRLASIPAQAALFSRNGIDYGTHRLSSAGLESAANIIEGQTATTALGQGAASARQGLPNGKARSSLP
jgi:UDP-glucose:(heptosyl)LPS alpha-1,3-glucosyltransferase